MQFPILFICLLFFFFVFFINLLKLYIIVIQCSYIKKNILSKNNYYNLKETKKFILLFANRPSFYFK